MGLLLLLKLTAFGKAVRAIGDDEEVSRIVGIDTRTVIAIVFFIGAVYAAWPACSAVTTQPFSPRWACCCC